MGYKEDADFAAFLSMGAVGTAAVAKDLQESHGHSPIELERYAMSNKIWQTKIKRLRLPDLLCTSCGLRVESRAKSKLALKLSDSDTPGREWNAGGVRQSDLFAFIRVNRGIWPPEVSSMPYYFRVSDLENALPDAQRGGRKAATEGSEVAIQWPAYVPARPIEVLEVRETPPDQAAIKYRTQDGARVTYWQWRSWGARHMLVAEGERVSAHSAIVAASVEPVQSLVCQGGWDVSADLSSTDMVSVYTAVKACTVENPEGSQHELENLADLVSLDEPTEDWQVPLEACVSLAKRDPSQWVARLADMALARDLDIAVRMETILAMSEIRSPAAAECLESIAKRTWVEDELRAAAAWGLGQGAWPNPIALLTLTQNEVEMIAIHSVRAVPYIPTELAHELVNWLLSGNDRKAAVAAHLLSEGRQVGILLGALRETAEPRWVVAALGRIPREVVLDALDHDNIEPGIVQTLETLWLAERDWLRTETSHEALRSLAIQKLRYS